MPGMWEVVFYVGVLCTQCQETRTEIKESRRETMTEVFLILIIMAVLWIVALVMLALVWVYGMKKKDRRKKNEWKKSMGE